MVAEAQVTWPAAAVGGEGVEKSGDGKIETKLGRIFAKELARERCGRNCFSEQRD